MNKVLALKMLVGIETDNASVMIRMNDHKDKVTI